MRPVRAITCALPALALLATVMVSSVACGSASDAEGAAGPDRPGATITVSAAASLTDAFTELADTLMAEDPSLEIRLNFGSSGQLAAQVRNGAPADVVAFADEETMAGLEAASLVEDPQVFATNRLAIITRPGNPEGITSLTDLEALANDGGIVALCARDAPCGRFADEVLERAGVSLPTSRVTRAANARATLTAVGQGDANAAIVYVTDAEAAGASVDVVTIPEGQNVEARYPIAAVSSSGSAVVGRAFVEQVLSERGCDVLEGAGFGPPP